MHDEHPELIRDQYWDDVLPDELPHTVASQALGNHSPYMGSTAHIEIPAQQTEIFNGSVTPQLHKLDEVSEDSTILDDQDIPSDGGESGYWPMNYHHHHHQPWSFWNPYWRKFICLVTGLLSSRKNRNGDWNGKLRSSQRRPIRIECRANHPSFPSSRECSTKTAQPLIISAE